MAALGAQFAMTQIDESTLGSAKSAAKNSSFGDGQWSKLLAAGIWAALIGTIVWIMRANDLTFPAFFLAGITWAQASPLAPLAYILLYALRPLTLFSSVPLTLAGGFLFGPAWGVLYTVVGANLSATVAFLVGRYFGSGVMEDAKSQGFVQRYMRRMRENSFETVLIMRLIFLPYDLVNYLAGFLRIGYSAFILATIIGSIPGTIAFVLLGASLSPAEIRAMFMIGKAPGLDWRLLAISGMMFLVSIALSRAIKRRERRGTQTST